MESTTEIKIFVSCPSDVEDEKDIILKVCHQLQNLSVKYHKPFRFHIHYWRDIVEYFDKKPQELINEVFDTYDIYLGILNMRFGTPTGDINLLLSEINKK